MFICLSSSLTYLSSFEKGLVFVSFEKHIFILLVSVFTEKYCTANHVDKLPGPRDWVQILQDQIKLARRRLKRGSGKGTRKRREGV